MIPSLYIITLKSLIYNTISFTKEFRNIAILTNAYFTQVNVPVPVEFENIKRRH